jgi:fructose/tagatose bisphosphate aldolase
MPVVPIREILDPAFADRYGVAAINIVDDLTLDAVLAAATELEAPLIVQTSLKTVKAIGAPQASQHLASTSRCGASARVAFVDAHREYLDTNPGRHHPPSLLAHVRAAVKGMAIRHISIFGSAGRARPLVTASR